VEVERGDGYVISTDKSRLDVDSIHRYLAGESYWARGRSRAVQERAIANSLCFGVYYDGQQVGFARVVTDCATFGWLCDVFVDDGHRGRGLGKWLVETVVAHPDLAAVRRLLLATRDAHELYRRYGGFDMLSNPERWMARQRE
jgi:GNAT superfamily N-acetyltransferase